MNTLYSTRRSLEALMNRTRELREFPKPGQELARRTAESQIRFLRAELARLTESNS